LAVLVSKDLALRMTSAAVGIPILLFVFYMGGIYLLIALGLISAIGIWEYRKILLNNGLVYTIVDIALVLAIYLLVAVPEWFNLSSAALLIALPAIICARLIVWHICNKDKPGLRDYLLTIFGWIYTGILVGLIYRLGIEYSHQKVLVLLLVLIWITDSAAYFIGMRFGKNRGIFPVSPKKSLEGFIAGLVAPCLIVIILYNLTGLWSLKLLLLIAVSAGLFGQMGDLLESKIKRTGGVKDSSNIIPGHGGVLDRFDSLLIAAPVLYALINLFA
jgi:phosphatidate cytidylyltransferase